ncbi:M23 family metallopeptidase [Paenibacillus woosongensis]|uniref:Peptidoglycan DD-metalloendopeptidase family protein n=1 Tax=Paenibacillus woosongensis TaxID=307580 RepID=A0A7X3CMY8_9BACL|nr:M23 family metallopeptidase [Paenibacillus woosongensis]MUG46138.1 peptidoglycan DD-metalloendopeptidase family protein [Paenibacillus woosongensis]
MDVKSNVKRRREERIKQLVSGGHPYMKEVNHGLQEMTRHSAERYPAIRDMDHAVDGERTQDIRQSAKNASDKEQDPEWMWKHGQGRWNDTGLFDRQDSVMPKDGKGPSFWGMLFIRLCISMLLFAGLWAVNRYEPPWAGSIRLFVAHSLTYEMDFGAAEAWYKRNFGGAPTFIPIFRQSEDKGVKVNNASSFSTPLDGRIASAFALSLRGINIVPANDSSTGLQVKSVETGRVLSVGNDAFTGETVVVQHAGGYVSIYGNLLQSFVEKGDWLESGDLVGKLAASSEQNVPTLYFALKKNDRYIDPADVIPFD